MPRCFIIGCFYVQVHVGRVVCEDSVIGVETENFNVLVSQYSAKSWGDMFLVWVVGVSFFPVNYVPVNWFCNSFNQEREWLGSVDAFCFGSLP